MDQSTEYEQIRYEQPADRVARITLARAGASDVPRLRSWR